MCSATLRVLPLADAAAIGFVLPLFVAALAVPMLGEIVDYDEKMFGQRREALFNGLANICWKLSMAISILIATQSMNWFGNSPEHPLGVYLVGPIAGVFGLLGAITIVAYPVLHVTRESNSPR